MIYRIPIMIAVLALGFAAWGANSAAAASPTSTGPGQYYLALGDSLAFGFQEWKLDLQLLEHLNVPPTAFTTGYVDDFTHLLQSRRPTIQTVNYGCPGLPSSQFISSPGCPSYPFALHNGYTGSPLAAALAFLHAHPGQVNPITLDIGVNDIEHLASTCGGFSSANLPCILAGLPAVLAQVPTNLNQILAALRQAAPSSRIIVLQYYNPYAVNSSLAAASNDAAVIFNAVVAQAALAHGALLADAFPAFNVGLQPETLCTLTLMCTSLKEIHASDLGYYVIATEFWAASGYGAG